MTASGRRLRKTSSAARLRMSTSCISTPAGASGQGRRSMPMHLVPAREEPLRDDVARACRRCPGRGPSCAPPPAERELARSGGACRRSMSSAMRCLHLARRSPRSPRRPPCPCPRRPSARRSGPRAAPGSGTARRYGVIGTYGAPSSLPSAYAFSIVGIASPPPRKANGTIGVLVCEREAHEAGAEAARASSAPCRASRCRARPRGRP